METSKPPVELVRVPREEQVYDREEVLGRDVTSVFPTQSKALLSESDAAKAAIGALKFVTESELAELKAQRGGRVEDGAVAQDKPLAAVLAEAKEAKEAAFQAQWKQMKQGKNRPLDQDELEFLDAIDEAQRRAEAETRQAEEQELDAFQRAVQQAAEARALPDGDAVPQPAAQEKVEHADAKAAGTFARRPLLKPVIQVVKRPATNMMPLQHQQQESHGKALKRQKAAEEPPGLAALIGDYSSDSDN